MTRNDVISVLKLLKIAYPRFYMGISKEEAENTISLYLDIFKDDDITVVGFAIKNLINELEFPPTIADIRKEINKMANTDVTPVEIWNKIKKAISNSTYHSKEEFENLPDIAKKFVGSANILREWGRNDAETNNTIIKSQFLKQYESLKNAEKYNKSEKIKALQDEEIKKLK